MDEMKSIIEAFSEDFELNKQNPWVKANDKAIQVVDIKLNDMENDIREAIYAAQELGFVEGMNFALHICNASVEQSNKAKEIISSLLKGA